MSGAAEASNWPLFEGLFHVWPVGEPMDTVATIPSHRPPPAMPRHLIPAFLLCIAALAGCDMLGVDSAEKLAAAREADGRAIGGACRHANRAIEDCYALNKKADKASVFAGWRDMNDYMRENKIEPVVPQIAGGARSGESRAESKSEGNKSEGKAEARAEARPDAKAAPEGEAPSDTAPAVEKRPAKAPGGKSARHNDT